MIHSEQFTVAGLIVNVFSLNPLSHSSGPIVALFFLHGRHGSALGIEGYIQVILERTRSSSDADDLMVITFDHRNHGSRLRDAKANDGWNRETELNNDRHALDMYAIQRGTAKDVSFLIDFLPAYLFPQGNRDVRAWGVAGTSLGGHSTWLALTHDARINFGVPIIGCPDYLRLMRARAAALSIPFSPPYFPRKLLDLIKQEDPVAKPYERLDPSNPFLNKKILILSGAADKLVPWEASREFVERLEVGPQGLKKYTLHEGVGHECTTRMLEELGEFVTAEYLRK